MSCIQISLEAQIWQAIWTDFAFLAHTVFDRSRVHHGSLVQYAISKAFLNGLARFFS